MPSGRGVGAGNHNGVPSLSVISPTTSARKVRSSAAILAGSLVLMTWKLSNTVCPGAIGPPVHS